MEEENKNTSVESEEEGVDDSCSLASHVMGYIDNGKGFYDADFAFLNSIVVYQSFSLFIIANCFAAPLTRAWGHRSADWRIVDNIDEKTLVIQRNIPTLIHISHGNKPAVVSETENTPCPLPHGIWMHGSTPLDQEILGFYYNSIMDDILNDSYHHDHAKVYLVLGLFPLKLLYLKW